MKGVVGAEGTDSCVDETESLLVWVDVLGNFLGCFGVRTGDGPSTEPLELFRLTTAASALQPTRALTSIDRCRCLMGCCKIRRCNAADRHYCYNNYYLLGGARVAVLSRYL
jgi:hypothetical protein